MIERTSSEATAVQQDAAVQAQYKTAQNLNIRISIHAKYSTNKQGLGNWIFSHYDLPAGTEILELGCGTGSIWKHRLPAAENGVRVFLTDFSEGMLSSARELLGEQPNLSYAVVNIQDIPYESGRFSRVIANNMLYHIPDLDRGLSEVKRVLADGGIFLMYNDLIIRILWPLLTLMIFWTTSARCRAEPSSKCCPTARP